MSHPPGHPHARGSHSAGGRYSRRLLIALALVGVFFVVELGAALTSGSLALLSDAGHMAADVVTLAAAVIATRLAARPDATGRRTFGHYRAEVFASGLAVVIMLAVGGYTAVEGVARLGHSQTLEPTTMLIVGLLGLAVNLAAMALLRAGAGESLNVKGAYLEVAADTLGSLGVIIAAVAVRWTANPLWDTGIALAIAGFVIIRAVALGREVLAVLAQHAPAGIHPASVQNELAGLEGIREVHDLHLWTLTSGMNVATAHLLLTADANPDAVLHEATTVLKLRFDIGHATLQVESTECAGGQW